jgi:hypothetical protein
MLKYDRRSVRANFLHTKTLTKLRILASITFCTDAKQICMIFDCFVSHPSTRGLIISALDSHIAKIMKKKTNRILFFFFLVEKISNDKQVAYFYKGSLSSYLFV